MPLYINLLYSALETELLAITPIVLVLLVVGLVTAVVQAMFQIEDATFSLLPKTIAMVAIALLGGFGALRAFAALATLWIGHAALLVHQPWS
jgi:flagellar biosynthesis protein FliQ